MRLFIVMLMCSFSAGCEAEQSKKCIAEAVYFEARNQPFHGQIAVANVIRNRAKRKHKSVCAIIKEPKQFSYRDNGVPEIKNKEAYQIALIAASIEQDLTGGAVFYNTVNQGIKWNGHDPVIIGKHIFYQGDV